MINLELRFLHFALPEGWDATHAKVRDAIVSRRSGLRRNDFDGCDLETWIGRVDGDAVGAGIGAIVGAAAAVAG